jgi:hypothetical protein
MGLHTYTMTASASDNNPAANNNSFTIDINVYCEITAITLTPSTITSPNHYLATSLPLAAPPTDTTIPLPTVALTPSNCGATITIVTIDTGISSTPTWLITPSKI